MATPLWRRVDLFHLILEYTLISSLDNSQPARPSTLVAKEKESTIPQIAG